MNIFHLFKLAAIEWGKDSEWIPEEFKKQEIFQNYPYKNPIKIFKKFGLNDFRIPLDLKLPAKQKESLEIEKELNNSIIENLGHGKKQLNESFIENEKEIEKKELNSILTQFLRYLFINSDNF